jgi:hypothetical protein
MYVADAGEEVAVGQQMYAVGIKRPIYPTNPRKRSQLPARELTNNLIRYQIYSKRVIQIDRYQTLTTPNGIKGHSKPHFQP